MGAPRHKLNTDIRAIAMTGAVDMLNAINSCAISTNAHVIKMADLYSNLIAGMCMRTDGKHSITKSAKSRD